MPRIVTLTVNPTLDYSVHVDEVVPYRKLRCDSPLREPGGGGLNVARALTGFGADVLAVYCAGGLTGRLLEELVDQSGVAGRLVEVSGSTREDFSAMEIGTGRQFRFVLPGPELSEEEWRQCLDTLSREMCEGCDFLTVSGSLPPGVPADFYANVARLAKRHGVRMVLDASEEPLKLALEEGVYLVKPNRREMAGLTGEELLSLSEQARAARELVARGGAEIVALTLGPAGALCAWGDQLLHAEAPSVEVRTTIGAGDSFVAGMTWALSEGREVGESFRWGVAAGTAAVTRADTQMGNRATAEELFARISVEPYTFAKRSSAS